jgi:hypothetical protein
MSNRINITKARTRLFNVIAPCLCLSHSHNNPRSLSDNLIYKTHIYTLSRACVAADGVPAAAGYARGTVGYSIACDGSAGEAYVYSDTALAYFIVDYADIRV